VLVVSTLSSQSCFYLLACQHVAGIQVHEGDARVNTRERCSKCGQWEKVRQNVGCSALARLPAARPPHRPSSHPPRPTLLSVITSIKRKEPDAALSALSRALTSTALLYTSQRRTKSLCLSTNLIVACSLLRTDAVPPGCIECSNMQTTTNNEIDESSYRTVAHIACSTSRRHWSSSRSLHCPGKGSCLCITTQP
jgi:hypothetical protein